MRAYDVMQSQWVAVILVAGAVLALAVHLALHYPRKRPPGVRESAEGAADHRQLIPVFLWLLYASVAAFAFLYVLRMWLTGMTF